MDKFGSFYSSISDRKFNIWCRYTTRLDAYGCGCQHDCSYCYAKSLLSFRGLWNANNPSGADMIEVKKVLSRASRGEVVKLGGMTDCFQPIERKERLTYRTILLLNFYRIHYLIVTKSDLVASDEYIEIYDKNLAHFQITLTSTSIVTYEKAPTPKKRIRAIEKLYKLGYDVSVRLSPFIEKFISFDVLNDIKCSKILIEFLKVNHWIKKWFDIDYSKYTLKYGGYEHLELDEKIRLVNMVVGFAQLSVGEYVKDHYE